MNANLVYFSNHDFKKLMKDKRIHLPIRWDGYDFEQTLRKILDDYILYLQDYSDINSCSTVNFDVNITKIETICSTLKRCVNEYHNGFPAKAYLSIERLLDDVVGGYLSRYSYVFEHNLTLFRVRKVIDGKKYNRKEVFHAPISARSIISTCRYSIAGYPSLYLTTSISLAFEEIGAKIENAIAAKFIFDKDQVSEGEINVLDLAIKPQDFIRDNIVSMKFSKSNEFYEQLRNADFCKHYLELYPIIATCSFIRANKSAPFASEYIVPQLIMQWIRTKCKHDELVGLRYFSCASIRASDMGYNYVFPVCNSDYDNKYCSVLRNAFLISEPIHTRDRDNIIECEEYLEKMQNVDRI